jgi:hypothetical protein
MREKERRSQSGLRPDPEDGLTRDEDNALRQLAWFELAGDLSDWARQRIRDLRGRDRRENVRNPRPDPSNG